MSLWTAVQTQTWRAGHGRPEAEAVSSFAEIDHLRAQLEDHHAAWARWFAQTGRTPVPVTYDAPASDPRGTVQGVPAKLGLPDAVVDGDATRRQGGARPRARAARYEEERG